MRQIFALGLGLVLLGQSAVAWAQPPGSSDTTSQQVIYGTGSVLGTLVYAPVKASFCILGAISSGFAFPIAGSKTAGQIASSTCGGTWVITPDELKGRERVNFVGTAS
jgi:hypothetical protein